MKLKNGDIYTGKELLAMYMCMHLETTEDGNAINENSKKNERIFRRASKLVGGREKLDALVARFMDSAKPILEEMGIDTEAP